MALADVRPPLRPGEPAPDFTLPAAHGDGLVSLADYRGRSPVLLALFRGLYCPFCRRDLVRLGATAQKLDGLGVQTLAIFATAAERARLYFRIRPPRVPIGADPDLATHRAYGVPQTAMTPEIWQAAESSAVDVARELGLPVPASGALEAISRHDGFVATESDDADAERHQAQFTGQFLVDRDGIVRWANIECARDGLAGLGKMPTNEEWLAAARALSG